jgi:hypothetical protein
MSAYLTPSIISEIICLFFSAVCMLHDRSAVWRWMIVFMLLTCLTEIGGLYIIKNHISNNNNWLYNIYLPIEIIFTYWMYANLIKALTPYYRIGLIAGLLLLGLVYQHDMYRYTFFKYANLTFTVFSVMIVLNGLYYYYLLFKVEKYIDLKFSPGFWWVTGTIFFYFGATVCNIFNEYYPESFYLIAYYIFGILNIILYGCWTYSFICRRWLMRS